jgi:nucleoside-diphosphate-sugar epimerase
LNILVTGGAGYVGSALVPQLLAQGHRVRVIDCLMHSGSSLLGVWSHPHFEFQLGDVRDAGAVQKAIADIDAVVHLAAIVGDPACARQPELARSINLEASLSLLSASQSTGVKRFVFASTCSNYGRMNDSDEYVDESSELRPISLYAETKVSVEKFVLDKSQTDGLCATSLRFATVFAVSPRMRFDLTVNEFTKEMLVNKKLVVFGEQFWRPYIHVGDVGRAIGRVLESPIETVKNEVFNVGSTSQNYQKQQIVELIQPYAPDAFVEYVHKEEDPRDYRVSFEKIKRELGFETTCTVPDGVREVAHLVKSSIIVDYEDQKYRN